MNLLRLSLWFHRFACQCFSWFFTMMWIIKLSWHVYVDRAEQELNMTTNFYLISFSKLYKLYFLWCTSYYAILCKRIKIYTIMLTLQWQRSNQNPICISILMESFCHVTETLQVKARYYQSLYIDYLICNSIDNNSIKMDNDKNWKVEKCDIFMSIPRNIRHWR